MNNKITPPTPSAILATGRNSRLPMLSVLLLSLVATGCYRSTGLQRNPLVAEEIPETGGDRVPGLKTTAGPGDYFLGNDFVQFTIDGTPFGTSPENVLAGAASGGSVVDAGYVELDTSFRRIAVPGDALDRLTAVVNQDPRLELVFDRFQPENLGETSLVVMQGRLLDPGHTITGATWDDQNCVKGVTVTHTVTLGSLDRFCTLKTILSNNGSAKLGIHNLGDFLSQKGAGFRFAIPATYNAAGVVLSPRWGLEIPGDAATAFAKPLETAVKAPMVGLLNTELGSATMDAHASLGFLPVDADQFLVTSDPQKALTESLPVFPERLVVGGLAVDGLAAGASLTHSRRLYLTGGVSSAFNSPGSSMGLFNAMDVDRYKTLRPKDFGSFQFQVSGTAQRQGPLPAEIRIERATSNPAVWELARVEWLEPSESVTEPGGQASSTLLTILPVGETYRVVARNRNEEYTKTLFVNIPETDGITAAEPPTYLPEPVVMKKDKKFSAADTDLVAPEVASSTDAQGNLTVDQFGLHYFTTGERDSPAGNLQPLRITLVGTGGSPMPEMRRQRTVATYFSQVSKGPELTNGITPGQYQFRGGNELFGTGFAGFQNTRFAWLPNALPGATKANTFTAFGTRGPLSNLVRKELSAYQGQASTETSHDFTVFPMGLPTGWTSFDMPGPSQATTGGYNPAEMLTSAMAEGVQVVARTEQDQQVDAPALYKDFRAEFNYLTLTDAMRPASLSDPLRTTSVAGSDPFVVGARSSTLAGYGTVSALFTPVATAARNGGARRPRNWTLADFLKQAEGQFNVIHRPRGPQGLFTLQGFDPTVAVGTGANTWWNGGGLYAFGKTNGGFDALELLRGEGLDGAAPGAWFDEFKRVRADWFALLNQQSATNFTKAVGLSSALFSQKTPVGLARTYLKTTPTTETDLAGVLSALKTGAAVVSTGPFLDVSVGTAGPGGLVAGPAASVTLKLSLTRTDWMPVAEVRIVVNGKVVQTLDPATLTQAGTVWTGSVPVTLPATGKGAWIVVEAGVPLTTTGVFAAGTPWNQIMRGIYPIAVTNPIFVDVAGGGYTAPGL